MGPLEADSPVDLVFFLFPYECWQIAQASWSTCLDFLFIFWFFPSSSPISLVIAGQIIGRRFGPLVAGGWAFAYRIMQTVAWGLLQKIPH